MSMYDGKTDKNVIKMFIDNILVTLTIHLHHIILYIFVSNSLVCHFLSY